MVPWCMTKCACASAAFCLSVSPPGLPRFFAFLAFDRILAFGLKKSCVVFGLVKSCAVLVGSGIVVVVVVVVAVAEAAVARVTGPGRALAIAIARTVAWDGAGHSIQAVPVRFIFAASLFHIFLSAAMVLICWRVRCAGTS